MALYGIEALLRLPEFHVIDQVLHPKWLEVHLQRREPSIVCPRCQTCCSRVQESRPRCVHDFPILERPVLLWLPMRRFACPGCRHRPWETSPTFGAHTKWTTRLSNQGREAFLQGCPCTALARRSGLSTRPVFRWTFTRSRGGRPRKLGRAIGMDAYARRKGHRDTTSIIDVDTGQPIPTLKGRRAEDGMAWFTSRPHSERDRVEGVVLAMSKTYACAIKALWRASVHVIDRFHGMKLAVDALDEVWRSVQKQRDPGEAKALNKLRRRWLTSAKQRKVDELIARWEWRRRFPELREVIAWVQDVRSGSHAHRKSQLARRC